jgi:hypothetical protein
MFRQHPGCYKNKLSMITHLYDHGNVNIWHEYSWVGHVTTQWIAYVKRHRHGNIDLLFWKFYFCLHRLIGQKLIYRTLYNNKFCQFIWRILLVELYFHYLKIIIFNIDVWTRWRWRGACEELDLFSIVILHYSVIDIERNLWSFLFILQSWRKINMKR